MKYIRTEYGKIYDVSNQHFSADNCCYTDEKGKSTGAQNCKVADTIEELCDEFVIEFEEKHHIVFDKNKLLKSVIDIQKMLFGGATILGAIWTNKGLIYVAKMNEKGELELL